METKDKVKAYAEQQNMLSKGDHIVLGFSGGADSVCLFYILQSLVQEYDLTLTAVHVNHGIRGDEALRDAAFVEELCDKEGIPCIVRCVEVPVLAQEAGLSHEEMGRKIRYEIFEEIAREVGANKIAVAHHKNDIAETMLFNLCRGTALAGLCALTPVRGKLIRPLLALEREEICEYLSQRQLPYCEDSTNDDTKYTRNYIRKEILPRLKEVNPKVVEHLAHTSAVLEGARDALDDSMEALKEKYVEVDSECGKIAQELFLEENEYLISGVLHNVIGMLAGSKKDIHGVHVNSVAELANMQVGKRLDLPYGLIAKRTYDGIEISSAILEKRETDEGKYAVNLLVPGETILWDGTKVVTRVFSAQEVKDIEKIPDKSYTKWFDYDIINQCISVRYRQAGDYMVVTADGGKKKLKELFIHEKVPQEQRDEILLFTREHLVLWACGIRMGEYGKIRTNTKTILEIKIHGGQNDE